MFEKKQSWVSCVHVCRNCPFTQLTKSLAPWDSFVSVSITFQILNKTLIFLSMNKQTWLKSPKPKVICHSFCVEFLRKVRGRGPAAFAVHQYRVRTEIINAKSEENCKNLLPCIEMPPSRCCNRSSSAIMLATALHSC